MVWGLEPLFSGRRTSHSFLVHLPELGSWPPAPWPCPGPAALRGRRRAPGQGCLSAVCLLAEAKGISWCFFFFFKLQVDCPLIFYSALDNTSYTQAMLPNSPITFPLGLSNLIPIALQIDTPISQPIATWNNSANTISPSLGKKKEKCIDFSVNVNFFFDYKCGINYHPPLAND